MEAPGRKAPELPRDRFSVKVGSGSSAHIFEPNTSGDVKSNTLRDGGSVFDYVLCGVGGELVIAEELPPCKTCERVAGTDE